MSATCGLDSEVLYEILLQVRWRGARTVHLVHHTPQVVDRLYPASDYPGLTLQQRAAKVELVIRQAIEAIGGTVGEAIATLLCLPAGMGGLNLTDRRRIAGDFFQVQGETFRRDRYEGRFLHYLAIEIDRLLRGDVLEPEADPL